MVIERDRKMALIRSWESSSISSSQYNSSPPTPKRRPPAKVPPGKSPNPSGRKCLKQQQPRQIQVQVGDTSSPPQRRNQLPEEPEKSQMNGSQKWPQYDGIPSPPRRPQSSTSSWKGNPKEEPDEVIPELLAEDQDVMMLSTMHYLPDKDKKVAPYGPKTPKRSDAPDGHESSQITYNPTFQSHSPSHMAQSKAPQPYIAQILTYPMSQQSPTYQNQHNYISPQQTYQDPTAHDVQAYPQREQAMVQNPVQPNIYFISPGNNQQDPMMSQKQQTALHLQQYVAMKQAQQTLFGYVPHGSDTDESYAQGFYAGFQSSAFRSHSAPARSTVPSHSGSPASIQGVPNPLQFSPIVGQMSSLVGKITPITAMGAIPPMAGPYPQTEVQYYQHFQNLQGRPLSATLNRYPPKDSPSSSAKGPSVCQSLNIVTQKTVGEIVPIGSEDLGVYQSPRQAYYSQAVPSDLSDSMKKCDSPKVKSVSNPNKGKCNEICRSQDTDEYV